MERGDNAMDKITQTSLIIKKENLYDKIRKSLFILIYKKDYKMLQRLEELMKPKRPKETSKIVIPKEMRKDFAK